MRTKKAIIKKVIQGKNKGQWVFVLMAPNGKVIAISESYTRKMNCWNTLKRYFPQFVTEDRSNEKPQRN